MNPPRWGGRCIGGIYLGERTFVRGGRVIRVRGSFGMEGITDKCERPVTARCQLSEAGKLLPLWWLACDDPEHRRDAGVVEHLDAEGRVVGMTRMLSPAISKLPPERVEIAAEDVEVLPATRKKPAKKNRYAPIDVSGETISQGEASPKTAPRKKRLQKNIKKRGTPAVCR